MTKLVGTKPNQVPVHGMLGTMAYQDAKVYHSAGLRVVTSDADPVAADINAGHASVWHNTTSGEVRLWVNIGGSLKSVELA